MHIAQWLVPAAGVTGAIGLLMIALAHRGLFALLQGQTYGLVRDSALQPVSRRLTWGCACFALSLGLVVVARMSPVEAPVRSASAVARVQLPLSSLPAVVSLAQQPHVPVITEKARIVPATAVPQWATVRLRDSTMLYLRETPGGTVRAFLKHGEPVRLLEQAPMAQGGHRWRLVSDARGARGWVDADFLQLAPPDVQGSL